MRSSTKRVLSIAAAGLFIIAVLIVYTNLIQPELLEVEKLRSLVTSKELLFDGQKKAVSDVQKLLEQFEGIASVEDAVSRALPLAEDVTYALSEYQSLLRTNSLSVLSFVVRPVAFESKPEPIVRRLGTLEVESAVSGSYEGIKNFVRGLETSARLMNVKTIQVQARDIEGQDSANEFVVNLVFDMYYQES